LERLLPYLDRAEVDYFLYNTAGPTEIPGRVHSVSRNNRLWFLKYLVSGKEPVIYFLNSQWEIWASTWFLSRMRRKKVVIALQGEGLRLAWNAHGRSVRRWILRGFEAAARVIAVNTHIRDFLEEIGGLGHKTVVVPGFIPPMWRDPDESLIADHVRTFCRQHGPVILATGAPVIRRETSDLYGMDITIELVDRLRKTYPRIGVLWSLLNIVGSVPEYADKMRDEITRRGLDAHWCFSPPQKVFYPVYKMVDLFVRPTSTDGDALSVREALYFGVPTVASDAAPRPEGVRLFRSRDVDDFERVVRQTLENLDAERERLKHRPNDTAVDKEVALLQEVIAEAGG